MSIIRQAAALAILGILGHQTATRADFVVGFDDVSAPMRFPDVMPGGPSGPTYSRLGVTFDGGVVLNSSFRIGDLATTPPNLYATSDVGPLGDGTRLPGSITATLSTPAFEVGLILVNGAPTAGLFTLTAFSATGTILASQSILIGPNFSSAFLGRLSVSSPAEIARFTVTTSQPPLGRNFAIDTVAFAVVPEPSTLLMVAIGGTAWIGTRGRGRRRGPRGPTVPLS